MNTTDLQVWDYVTDQGRRVSVVLSASGDLGTRRNVSATVTVDDVERLRTDGHLGCPENVPLGEWIIHALLGCLSVHMAGYTMFQMLNNLLSMAQADELQFVPVDDRHIAELTDEQAEWWNEDSSIDLIEYLFDRVRPAAEQAVLDYPQLGKAQEENN